MNIVYMAPDINHPSSKEEGISVFDLATILEGKYGLLEKFTEDNSDEIVSFMFKRCFSLKKGFDLQKLNGRIQYLWREWILGRGHGIITKAAEERGDPSFVHTSAYYLGISVAVELDEKDESFIVSVLNGGIEKASEKLLGN